VAEVPLPEELDAGGQGLAGGFADPEAVTGPARAGAPTTARAQVRGSSLLLIGRGVTLVVNFLVQVIIVRALSETEYGAFAYALSIADIGQTLATFGLDRTISRFLAIDDERGRMDRVFGTILFVTAVTTAIGVLVVVAVLLAGPVVAGPMTGVPDAQLLIGTLVLLAPIQALDGVLTNLLSVYASPRAIFVRRFVLAPALRLGVVAVLVILNAGVVFLAAGYVAAGAIGLAIYAAILVRIFHTRGMLGQFRLRSIQIPVVELLAFTIPLLTTDLVYVVLNTSDAILLGIFGGPDQVARFRVVLPAAGLNQVVFQAFTLLYVPAASRLFARRDRAGIRDLYWQTAVWMAVISFPLFALTFSLAGPLTTALYEQRYADSAPYLAMLSFGYYVNTALGFNGLTLRVYGELRYIVLINLAAAALNVALNVALIPVLGPLGAAIGTMTTLLVHNALKQAGLRLGTGIDLFERRYLRVYLSIGGVAAALLATDAVLRTGIVVSLVLAGIASAVVFLLNRNELRIASTFPEVLRLPFGRRLFGG
jgi:O-antigen/teichoic acid export membrane protein